MDPNAAIFYEFGVFRLDPVQKILSAETEDIRLSPKAFDLLLFLARNPNQVIPKAMFVSEVWRDYFVEEAKLAVQISNLRKIFSAVPHNSVSIETFPKVGYRFAASVVIKPADVAPKPDSSFTNSEPTAIKQRDLKFRQGFRASWLFE